MDERSLARDPATPRSFHFQYYLTVLYGYAVS